MASEGRGSEVSRNGLLRAHRATSGLPQAQVPGLSEVVSHFGQSLPQAQT